MQQVPRGSMDGVGTASEAPFVEDLCPDRRSEVSISSVESEPIKRRPRAGGSDDEDAAVSGDERDGRGNNHEDQDGEGVEELRAVGGLKVSFETDPEVAAMAAQLPAVVPPNLVSAAAVATVVSTMPQNGVCVAEIANGALPMDLGTHFCLEDGRSIGYLASLLGPVHHPFYVVSSRECEAAKTVLESDAVAEGVPVHYDLANQRVIFDVAAQCDVTRGTDASYVNDDELPENVRPDFSDDEEELRWKREYKLRRKTDKDAESISSEEEAVDDVDWSRVELEDDTSTTAAVAGEKPAVIVPDWLTQ